ncbi:NAD(P)-binding domain-containing protein, partial [Bacillus cereus]|nr:NAD(P)-binding domain-containing protein [Bacillus cereus]
MTKKIGFIGLGIMGRPMSLNLLKADYELAVFDINQETVTALVASGAHAAASPKEVAERSEIIFT